MSAASPPPNAGASEAEAIALLADVLAVWRLEPASQPAQGDRPAGAAAAPPKTAVGRPAEGADTQRRRGQGYIFCSKPLGQPGRLLHGQQQSLAKLPAEVATALTGRRVHSFAQTRRAVWRALAASSYADEFGPGAAVRMAAGMAPQVPAEQCLGRRCLYELHHLRPLHCHLGGMYDLANLVVVTPLYHHALLHPAAHYRRRR